MSTKKKTPTVPKSKKSSDLEQKKLQLAYGLLAFGLLVILVLATILVILKKPKKVDGPEGLNLPENSGQEEIVFLSEPIATVTVETESPILQQNQKQNFEISVDIPKGRKVDGFQIVGYIDGVDPDATFTFNEQLEINPVATLVSPTDTGISFMLAFISTSPTTPFLTDGSKITFGTITATPNDTSVAIEYDAEKTKIMEHLTLTDLAIEPTNATFDVE